MSDGGVGPRAPTEVARSRSPGDRRFLQATVLAAAVAYTLTAPRWILGGDNGEFSTLFATGGIAHPPGYPTLVLWLRLWSWLPVDTPAHGAALATAFAAALSVWALQRACLRWGASPRATALATSVYAFSPLAWTLGSHAEAMAMNVLFAGVILALAAPTARLRRPRSFFFLGLVAGVAIGNHQSIVFLFPVGCYAVVRGLARSPWRWRAAAAGSAGLLVGVFLPYVYVYVTARTGDPRTMPMWIEERSIRGVLFHFRRGAYGTFSLAGQGLGRAPLTQLRRLLAEATLHLFGAPIFVVIAVATWVARGRRGMTRVNQVFYAMLAVAFLVAGPIFVASFDVPTIGPGRTVVERFYLLPEALMTVFLARSMDEVLPWLLSRPAWTRALTVSVGATQAILAVPKVLEHHRPSVALYIENTLATAPADAILVGTGDHRWGGFMYARYALHARPDVLYVVPAILTQAWYRHELEDWLGVSCETPEHRAVGPRTLLRRLFSTGRPLLYTDWPDPKLAATPHYTVGTLMRVISEEEPLPDTETLLARNIDAFARYDMEPTPPEDEAGWGRAVQPDYARPWLELSRRFAEAHDVTGEQACYAQVARWAPWLVRVE